MCQECFDAATEGYTAVQATLPSPPDTFKPMMAGVYVAYALVAW